MSGAFLLYGVFAILKFVLAAVGGLFVVREIDQQFGKEGRKTSKLFEKAGPQYVGERCWQHVGKNGKTYFWTRISWSF